MRETSRKVQTTVEILLVTIIAAFLGATALGLFVDIFWNPDSAKASDPFRGALWGAFFAFIFVRVGEVLTRMYQASRDSRKALSAIQFTLNEALSISNDNLFVFEQWDHFYRILTTKPLGAPTPVFLNSTQDVPELRSLLMDLSSIGLVNELFLLNSGIRKFNDSMNTWQRAHQFAKDAFTNKSINEVTFTANMGRSQEAAQELIKFQRALIEEMINALAGTRLQMRYRPFFTKLYRWLNPDRYVEHTHRAHVDEVKKMRAEMEAIKAESKVRIESISPSATRPPGLR